MHSSGSEGQVCMGRGRSVFWGGDNHTLSLEFSEHIQYRVQLQSESLQLFSPALSDSPPAVHLTPLLLLHHPPRVCDHLHYNSMNVTNCHNSMKHTRCTCRCMKALLLYLLELFLALTVAELHGLNLLLETSEVSQFRTVCFFCLLQLF